MDITNNIFLTLYLVVTFFGPLHAVINKPLKVVDLPLELTINKVSFTQKGYIQFLKYVSKVPPIRDYTFCIWVRSTNFTYTHPLLSYSKNEKERLIRVWISAGGTSLNLELVNRNIFELPIKFNENRWYHICQSWSSYEGLWSVYVNGNLKSSGIKSELKGLMIKGGGDIVVGQEYTDFDKGLDDGIEGDVFGFNFVLSSTITTPKTDYPPRRYGSLNQIQLYEDVPQVLSYFSNEPNRKSKNFLKFSNNFLDNMVSFFGQERKPLNPSNRIQLGNHLDEFIVKSQGLKLVELGFNNCFLGRGAPVSGRDVLISWTRTPVRVFGGATLKNVPPFCIKMH